MDMSSLRLIDWSKFSGLVDPTRPTGFDCPACVNTP